MKTKEDERKKKKEEVLEGCLLFPFLLFCLFFNGLFSNSFLRCGDFGPNLVVFFVFCEFD